MIFQAFYNPAQIFNRDLSCALLEEFAVLIKEERLAKKLKAPTIGRAKKQARYKEANPEAEVEGAEEDDIPDPEKGITVIEALAASGK